MEGENLLMSIQERAKMIEDKKEQERLMVEERKYANLTQATSGRAGEGEGEVQEGVRGVSRQRCRAEEGFSVDSSDVGS